tara:strand:- start:51 stop:338 length:288 start_codon:yes stop_codon:yes gene_type:complete
VHLVDVGTALGEHPLEHHRRGDPAALWLRLETTCIDPTVVVRDPKVAARILRRHPPVIDPLGFVAALSAVVAEGFPLGLRVHTAQKNMDPLLQQF